MPFAACRSYAWFSRSDGGPNRPPPRPESNLSEPAQNRVKVLLVPPKIMYDKIVRFCMWRFFPPIPLNKTNMILNSMPDAK